MKKLLCFFSLLVLTMNVFAENKFSPETIAAQKAFVNDGFGIFIHWGIYAIHGKGEWWLNKSKMPLEEYEAVASQFNPTNFDANAWAEAFADAGARYVTITSRHHDGFSIFATTNTTYDIVDATPYKRDPIAELASACKKNNLKLGFYYSLLDWRREDFPRHNGYGDYDSYYAFMKGQLGELLTNYGPINCLWFDGQWARTDAGFDWRLPELFDYVRSIQPSCLVGNNSHVSLQTGEDFQIWEINFPGGHTGHMNDKQTIATNVPLECCWSMTSDAWGYQPNDLMEKNPSKELIRKLVRTRVLGANLLLNIAPAPDGSIPKPALERLKDIGEWMRKYGDTIIGAKPGHIYLGRYKEYSSIISTISQDGNTVHLHILNDNKENYGIWMPFPDTIVKVTNRMTGEDVPYVQKMHKSQRFLSLKVNLEADVPDTILDITIDHSNK